MLVLKSVLVVLLDSKIKKKKSPKCPIVKLCKVPFTILGDIYMKKHTIIIPIWGFGVAWERSIMVWAITPPLPRLNQLKMARAQNSGSALVDLVVFPGWGSSCPLLLWSLFPLKMAAPSVGKWVMTLNHLSCENGPVLWWSAKTISLLVSPCSHYHSTFSEASCLETCTDGFTDDKCD